MVKRSNVVNKKCLKFVLKGWRAANGATAQSAARQPLRTILQDSSLVVCFDQLDFL